MLNLCMLNLCMHSPPFTNKTTAQMQTSSNTTIRSPNRLGEASPPPLSRAWMSTRKRLKSINMRGQTAHNRPSSIATLLEKKGPCSLQKQIGCFNHRVVTLVADKPKRQWLCTVYFADYIRQLERKLPRLSYNQHLAVSNH